LADAFRVPGHGPVRSWLAGPVLRQNTMAVGISDRGGSSLHGSQEAERAIRDESQG
jgi:hypothetical protein